MAAMKKYSLFAAGIAALVAFSCTKESVSPVGEQAGEEGRITVLTAGFQSGEDGTRTVRQTDGKVFWSPGNAISVLRGSDSDSNQKFVTDISEPSPTAEFTGTMPAGTSAFWTMYPYDPEAYLDNGFLVTSLPYEQEAVAGSFADDLFISAAYVRANSTSMTFYHQCGGVKFSVTQPGIRRVTLIPASEDVYLAGLIAIYANITNTAPYIRAIGYPEYMSNTVVLSAPEGRTLEVGAAYHFVTIPNYMEGGFSLLFEKEDGSIGIRAVKKDILIEPACFATLLEADKGVVFRTDYLDYSPSTVTLDGLGGAFAIDVNGTLDYSIEPVSDWIHEEVVSGNVLVNRRHVFSAERNEGGERQGTLKVSYGGKSYPVTVTQSALGWLKVYPHRSLGLRFAATWCGNCPVMHETFRKAAALMEGRFEYVCLYDNDGNYGFAGSETLASQYLIGGYPTGIIDGWFDLPNYEYTDYGAAVIDLLEEKTVGLYPTATALGVESSLSGRNLSVKVDVKAQYAEGYKLTVFLCESGIVGSQQSGSDVIADFVHNRVARMSLTEYTGDAFDVTAVGDVKTFNFTATIPSGYKTENMEVVAFVQRSYNDRPAVQTGSYGSWYIDNCRAAAFGASAPLEVE